MTLAEIIMAEYAKVRRKAGIVPFLSDGRCLFVVSPGDSVPEIAKGEVSGTEDTKSVAIREGAQKLGLVASNMAINPWLGWSGVVKGGDSGEYEFDVYGVLVKDAEAFNNHSVWLTRAEFTTKGHQPQTQIMNKLLDKIEVYLEK